MPQAREKFLSLRKGTKSDVASVLEEVLLNVNVMIGHLHIIIHVFIVILEIINLIIFS